MNPAARNAAIGLAVITLAGACALPYQRSQMLDKRWPEMAAQTPPQSDVLLRNLQHSADYLQSKGSVDIVLRDRCHADDATRRQHLPGGLRGAAHSHGHSLKPL